MMFFLAFYWFKVTQENNFICIVHVSVQKNNFDVQFKRELLSLFNQMQIGFQIIDTNILKSIAFQRSREKENLFRVKFSILPKKFVFFFLSYISLLTHFIFNCLIFHRWFNYINVILFFDILWLSLNFNLSELL